MIERVNSVVCVVGGFVVVVVVLRFCSCEKIFG